LGSDVIRINDQLAVRQSELVYRFSRASGPGGQNVNRTSSRVELVFDVDGSLSLSESQRALVRHRLASLIDGAGLLRLVSDETPSQWRNRQEVLARFQTLLARALRPSRRRIATRPTAASRERRLESKRRRSAIKWRRRRASPET
jgi:ribosome-associated protein